MTARGRRQRTGRPVWWLAVLLLLAAAVIVARLGRPPRPEAMDVFFVHYDAARHHSMLVATRRTTVSGGTEARLAVALHALLAGPTPQEKRRGLGSEIPLGTTLRSVQVRGGVATVDLTPSFSRGGGSSSMMGRVWQVVYTATQFPDASAAQILLDGERVQTLGGEGVMIGEPLRRGASLPTF